MSTVFAAQLVNWQYGRESIGKIGILLNDLKRNSSSGNEDKQNEDAESVIARLYPSGRGERERLKNVRADAATDVIFFIRIRKISLVVVQYYATKAVTMHTAKERQRDRSFP